MAYIEWWNRTGPITMGERFGLNEISTARDTLSPTKSYAKKPYNWEEGDWTDPNDDSVGGTKILEDFDISTATMQKDGGRIGLRYAGPVKLIEIFEKIMKKPNYSLEDAVVAVNKLKLKYSPDKIKTYFKNFVSDKRSMSTEEYLTYIKERIKDTSLPHKVNWNKPLMGSPLEVKGFGKRKNVPVSNLMDAEKQLSAEELKLWRTYTTKQQDKAKFARKVAGERIDPVTGDVIKDPRVRSDWLSKAYIRKGIRRAKKHDAYKQLSPLERLKLEFFEKRLNVMGNIIKDNPALLKNKEIMKFLETGVDAKTGRIIKSPVDFSQIKERRFWELEHIDPIKGGQTKTRGSFLSNVQVLPKSIHKNFKEPAEKFLNENWGKKEYANEINEILKKARELKVTLRVNDVGPVGYKARFENFLDKADDVFNFYVRDSGAKKLYSETIAEMKPANIKFNWKNLGFKEAPSEEIIQKAITETTRPAFKGIKDAVLISPPVAVAAEAAEAKTLETGDKTQEANVLPSVISEHPILSSAAAVTAAAPKKVWEGVKWAGKKLLPIMAPGASHLLHGGEYDLTSGSDLTTMGFWNSVIKSMGKTSRWGNKHIGLAKRLKDIAWRGGIPTRFLPYISGTAAVAAGPMLIKDAAEWLQKRIDKEGLTGMIEEQSGIIGDEAGASLLMEDVRKKQKESVEGMDYATGGIASLIK